MIISSFIADLGASRDRCLAYFLKLKTFMNLEAFRIFNQFILLKTNATFCHLTLLIDLSAVLSHYEVKNFQTYFEFQS